VPVRNEKIADADVMPAVPFVPLTFQVSMISDALPVKTIKGTSGVPPDV
jgi:hypothetical protein